MPSYTVHYSNSPHAPPLGALPTVETDDLDAALAFARQNCPQPSHQPSVGDARGFWICDEQGSVVVPWQPRDAEAAHRG